MHNFTGKTAFVTGAAHGQGRSHAVSFARAGANVVISDLGHDLSTIPYPMGTPEELDETRGLIEETGAGCLAAVVDARDSDGMNTLVAEGIRKFGAIDVASINHGIAGTKPPWEMSDDEWDETISVNLTGAFRAARAVMPNMIENKRGSIVLTASVNGLYSYSNMPHYAASKHGVIGLVRSFAVDLAPYGVRANAVCPTTVPTAMIMPAIPFFAPEGKADPGLEDIAPTFKRYHLLDVPWVQPEDISAAVLWLASDEARYVTGIALPVDAGATAMPAAYPLGTELDYQ